MTNARAYWQLTACAAIWGMSWLAGRVMSMESIPAAHSAIARFAFASAGLLLGLLLARRPWPPLTRHTAWILAAMGFAGVFCYNVCFFTGLRTVPAGRASLMAALQPSIIFLFSVAVWRERVTPVKVSGLALSLAGAILVLSQGDVAKLFAAGLNTGDIWVLGCVASWVAYTLLGRMMAGRMDALPATAYSTWAGTAMLAVYALLAPAAATAWSPRAWGAAAFLGILGTTIAFQLFLEGVAHVGAPRASIFINLVPVFGVLFSALLLGERIGAPALIGGAIVILGVRLLNR